MTTPIEVEALPGSPGLRITGELDASNVALASKRLLEQARRSDEVTVDLTGLRFIDSAGLNALIGAAQALEGRGRLTIRCRTGGGVRRVLDLMGLADALEHVVLEEIDGDEPGNDRNGEAVAP